MNVGWKAAIAECLREGWHEIWKWGGAHFIRLDYEPSEDEKDAVQEVAEKYFHDVWWSECPHEHGDFEAVLCCGALREDEEE